MLCLTIKREVKDNLKLQPKKYSLNDKKIKKAAGFV
jgi:hypothetical protein